MANKTLFLDRDGVVNLDHGYLYEPEKFEFIQGVFEACRLFQAAGFKIVVVTNQSGIGRGYYTEQDFLHLTDWMVAQFKHQGIDVLDGLASVVGDDSVDVTAQFVAGAENALKLCQKQQIKYAVLAEGSPSCGSSNIYDGTFSGTKIDGSGVTATLLKQNGIRVFSQHTIADLRTTLDHTKTKSDT